MAAPIKTRRFYQEDRVSTELHSAVAHSIFQYKGGLLAQRTAGAEVSSSIMVVSNTNTVMSELGHAGLEQYPYTPYGRRPAHSERNNPMAFNGEQLDSVTGCYLLGNGYRLFSPTLKRFYSPDNLSPFEEGGLSTYAYCAGDPVNRTDPTGHAVTLPGLILVFAGSIMTAVGGGFLMEGGMRNNKKSITIGATLVAAGSLLLMVQGARFAKSTAISRSFRNGTPQVTRNGAGRLLTNTSEHVVEYRNRFPVAPPSYEEATRPPTYYEATQLNTQQPGYSGLLGSNNNRIESMQMQALSLRHSSIQARR